MEEVWSAVHGPERATTAANPLNGEGVSQSVRAMLPGSGLHYASDRSSESTERNIV